MIECGVEQNLIDEFNKHKIFEKENDFLEKKKFLVNFFGDGAKFLNYFKSNETIFIIEKMFESENLGKYLFQLENDAHLDGFVAFGILCFSFALKFDYFNVSVKKHNYNVEQSDPKKCYLRLKTIEQKKFFSKTGNILPLCFDKFNNLQKIFKDKVFIRFVIDVKSNFKSKDVNKIDENGNLIVFINENIMLNFMNNSNSKTIMKNWLNKVKNIFEKTTHSNHKRNIFLYKNENIIVKK